MHTPVTPLTEYEHAPATVAGVEVPNGEVAQRAWTVAAAYCPPHLLLHSARSFVWGALAAVDGDLDFDADLLWVAALFHDLGLAAAFDNFFEPFEDASAAVADVFAVATGMSWEARENVGESIRLHISAESVPYESHPEAHLLQVGVSFDVAGQGRELFDVDAVRAVTTALPRHDFDKRFLADLHGQALRKPSSEAARLIRGDAESMIAANGFSKE